jgi:formamidopyrimidine-DNA glycosylase
VLETASHRFALCDPRRFGFVDLVDTAALEPGRRSRHGPEPLGRTSPRAPAAALRRPPAGDQAAAARPAHRRRARQHLRLRGAVPRAIDPRKAAGTVSRPALARLVPAIREVLEQAIGDGGSTLRDYARPDGELGYFATRFAVYGREGKPARAQTAARSAHRPGRAQHLVLPEVPEVSRFA